MSNGMGLPFAKMNGLGNEIVVIDLRGSARVFTPAEAHKIATQELSHFDQMMVLHDPKRTGTSAFVRIYNTDGSESAACGNGTRCIGWTESQRIGKPSMTFETKAGLLRVDVESQDRITVDMGEPKFKWDEIPLAEAFHDTRGIELQIGPIDNPVLHSPSAVNVGNPHAVFWVDDVSVYDLGKFGPLLENHPIFPERANISLAHVTSRSAIALRTWERGTGLTKACGTAACAAAVSAARKNLTDRKVTVTLPGGPLMIEWTAENRILMTGAIEMEHLGRLDASLDATIAT
jgi:diaminopimelate epimerase